VQRLLPEFIQQFKPNFPVGIASPDSVYGYLQLSFMQRNYVPDMVFLDRKGVIRAQYAGTDAFFQNERTNIRAKFDELLKEPGAAAPQKKAPPAKKAAPPKKT
jgi:hypothetical protein